MIVNVRKENESAVPWWAAFGAPLLGVPILVGLLALGSPSEARDLPPDTETVLTGESLDAAPATVHIEQVPDEGLLSHC